MSVGLESQSSPFKYYSNGVLTSGCGSRPDHGVLVIGYGTENGTPYWLVKNSWGANWGDNGYIKIRRYPGSNDGGLCGIQTMASYPVI